MEDKLKTYPDGYNNAIEALDFVPEENREKFLKGLIDVIFLN